MASIIYTMNEKCWGYIFDAEWWATEKPWVAEIFDLHDLHPR